MHPSPKKNPKKAKNKRQKTQTTNKTQNLEFKSHDFQDFFYI